MITTRKHLLSLDFLDLLPVAFNERLNRLNIFSHCVDTIPHCMIWDQDP